VGIIGVDLKPEAVCMYCNKMQLGPAEYIPDIQSIRVNIPPTRSDILHPVDVIEDVAIAYGYNNIPLNIPKTICIGAPLPANSFTDLIRAEVSRAGYLEILTHGLCSRAENFTHLLRPVGPAVALSNPANIEYEVVRTTLLPGAFKTLSYNKSMSHKDGIKLFEISDVVLVANNEVGAINERHFVGLYSSYTSGFEHIHGLVDRIMTCAQIEPEEKYALASLTNEEYLDRKRVARQGVVYCIQSSQDPCHFQGMSANIILKFPKSDKPEIVVGTLGVAHPDVLRNFDISYPCSIVEINMEALM